MRAEGKKSSLWLRLLKWIALLALAAVVWELITTQNPKLLSIKRGFIHGVLGVSTVDAGRETEGLCEGYTVERYLNGAASQDVYSGKGDGKTVYRDGKTTRLVNYLDGYQLDFPAGTEFDFSLSPLYTFAGGDGFDCTVSRETATYAGLKDVVKFELSTFFPFYRSNSVESHVEHYEYRFLRDESWLKNNGVVSAVTTDSRGDLIISAVLTEPGSAKFDRYLYCVHYTGSREYIRVTYRFDSGKWGDVGPDFLTLFKGMRSFDPTGEGVYSTDYKPVPDENWTEETKKLYDELKSGTELKWGIFTGDIFENGIDSEIPELEKKLDFTFPIVLCYIHENMEFPAEFMDKAAASGKTVELTYQMTANNNTDLCARSPLLDIVTGAEDGPIRSFARAAAAWGRPFIFRLNNEMNSDWTSYSGVVNLCDPQLFKEAWAKIYGIFREEGVDNCIWVFNPHDRSAPPAKWNDALCYYPGNEYVHMLGVTGYNNGTYYSWQAETWRSFREIYDAVEDKYAPFFSEFPWMITEFASSSFGGDKAEWIDGMFAALPDYPRIKAAVWFSSADYDGDVPARPYWLDETEATVEAFRRGVHK